MNGWTRTLGAALAISSAACSSSPGGDGRGGDDGAGGGAATVGASGSGGAGPVSASSGTSSAATPGTGPGASDACDKGDCGACAACSMDGACVSQTGACEKNQECVALYDCISDCKDDACFQKCTGDHPSGRNDLGGLVHCIVCQACYGTCGGADSCG